jgi:hypothetical protein
MRKLLFLFFVALSGCATERIVPVEIKIPVPVPCVFDDVPEPQVPEKGANIFEKVRALLVEIELRKSYEEKLKASISVCKNFDPNELDQ